MSMSIAPAGAAPLGAAPTSMPPSAGSAVPVPAVLQPTPVTGGGPSADLQQAIQDLWGAIGALKGALDGAANVTGGGGSSSGCGCGVQQASAGSGALGAPKLPRSEPSSPSTPAPAPAPAPIDAPVSDWKAPKGYRIKNPLEGANVTSSFGEVSSIRNNRPHGGTDLSMGGANGKPIHAAAPGKVVEVKTDSDGYGNYVTIDHGNGWYTRYGHMLEKSPLKQGDTVKAGDTIGKVGSTGNSTGPHLHFEVLEGGTGQSNRRDAQPFLDGKKTFG
jgi:murein DD-endopeptidase MepM/ murein hydrolase activator NlpD